MRVDNRARLEDGQRSEVLRLVAAASEQDGVAPLSEQSLLAVRGVQPTATDTDAADATDATTGAPHFLAYAGTHLAGYAHLDRPLAGEAATAEVVVDPARRRQGVGTALVRALESALETPATTASATVTTSLEPGAGTLRLWAHGHLDAARAFAARDGYSSVRELWAMRRSLGPDADPLPAVSLPEGFRYRHFVVGQDEDDWLRVNARAFADHPEQGRITHQDLERRLAEPWFDARGFILFEDTRGFTPVLAASHWTKVVPAQDPQVGPTQGEVYVVGVDPAYQGLGLGQAVSILGLQFLRDRGMTEAMLYVDADNTAAIRTYSRLGFVRFALDVMYSPAVHPSVPR